MRAAILDGYHKNGGDLLLRDLPIPEPAEREVLVKVHTAGVNPLDNMILREAASKLASNLEKPVKNSTAYTMVTISNAVCESESDLMVDPYLNSIGAPPGA